MTRALACLLILASTSVAAREPALSEAVRQRAAALRDEAARGTRAYEWVSSLTTEVGPRLAGSRGDKAAVEWGLRVLRQAGFDDVRAEPVTVPHWDRGVAEGEILSPYRQVVALAALGGSVGTPQEGLVAEVVGFGSLAELEASAEGSLAGKIAFINGRMLRTRDGEGYGATVGQRSGGAVAAAKRGAVALLIRSVGTDRNRTPHTGSTRYDEAVRKIPAAALSNPDADLLEAQLAHGRPVSFRLLLGARVLPDEPSANVIGEVRGREKPDEIVLLGCHLDSWDLGTGALDDGAGCAIVIEAGRRLLALPERPRRTVRVVLFANEEFGLSGARAYAEAHKSEVPSHVMTVEADLGADRVYSLTSAVSDAALPALGEIAELLAPLGIARGANGEAGGADLSPLRRESVPAVSLNQDASAYFDFHHTANDTLDKVDRGALDQSVAAYLTLAYASAESRVHFGPAPPQEAGPPRRR